MPSSTRVYYRIGEAKNPGPCGTGLARRAQHTPQLTRVDVLTINAGGSPGCWRALASGFFDGDVVCLQEASMSKAEFGGFARQAKRKGYTAFQCGTP